MYTPKFELHPKFKNKKVNNRPFRHIAEMVSRYRTNKKLSQEKLSKKGGFASSQLLSNIERGLQSLKASHIYTFCRETDCPKDIIFEAILSDKRAFLEKQFQKSELEYLQKERLNKENTEYLN